MMATEIPAAIKPYSIAVAPVSSFKNRTSKFFISTVQRPDLPGDYAPNYGSRLAPPLMSA
jgi:hypothetical protein